MLFIILLFPLLLQAKVDEQAVFWYLDSETLEKLEVVNVEPFLMKVNSLAEQCINKSFDSAGSSLRIKLNLQPLSFLSEKFLAKQTETVYLAFDKEDKSFINGVEPLDQSIYVFFQNKKREINFVPQYYSERFQESKMKVSKIKPETFETTDAFYSFLGADLSAQKDPESNIFQTRFIENVKNEDFQNTLYLSSTMLGSRSFLNENPGVKKNLSITTAATFAHEILHAWGNLDDSYYFEYEVQDGEKLSVEKFKDGSIMAEPLVKYLPDEWVDHHSLTEQRIKTENDELDQMNCRLTLNQVRSIELYRQGIGNWKRPKDNLTKKDLDLLQK